MDKRSDNMEFAAYEGANPHAEKNPHHTFAQIRKGSYRAGYKSQFTGLKVRRCNNADRGDEVQIEIEICTSTEKQARTVYSSFNLAPADAERLANILLGKEVA